MRSTGNKNTYTISLTITLIKGNNQEWPGLIESRVSSETSFVSKQTKLELKLVSTLSETRHLFRLFRFNIKTGSFGVSKQPK
jgi:hypothetical protein